jgi:signal transduction histidine kinase
LEKAEENIAVSAKSSWNRMVLAPVAIVLVLWIFAFLWILNAFVGTRVTALRAETASIGASYGSALASALNQRLALVEGLAAFITVKVHEPPNVFADDMRDEFPQFAAAMFRVGDGVRNISVSPDFVVRWIFPDELGNRKVVGNNILEDKRPGFAAAVRRAIDSRGVSIHEPVELIQGGLGLIARKAIYADERPWGAVGMAFMVEPLIKQAGLQQIGRHLVWGVRTAAGTAVAGNGSVFSMDPVITRISLPDGFWELAVAPEVSWDETVRSSVEYHMLQAAMVALGILILLLLLNQTSNRQNLREEVSARTADLWEAKKVLERHSLELARAHEELERFAYVAAHDLQEPLRSITSFSQLIQRTYKDKLDDEGQEWLTQVADGGQRMRLLLRDIQLYLAEASLPMPTAPYSAVAALEDAKAKLAVAIKASDAVIESDPLPEVMADRRRLTEVMTVLLSNAIEYRSPGRPAHVRITSRREGNMRIISVEDNGIGIAPEYHKRIFEVFQRLHGRQEHPGTGMGLAIAHKMVLRLGGYITLSSVPGQGSVFSLHLPGL